MFDPILADIKNALIRLSQNIFLESTNMDMVKYYEGAVNAGDVLSNRKFRHRIINEIIEPFLIKRDDKRHFTEFEKQFLWHSNPDKICGICGGLIKEWSDYQIDHITPWDLGGVTNLSNAQLAHSSCNKSKGNRM